MPPLPANVEMEDTDDGVTWLRLELPLSTAMLKSVDGADHATLAGEQARLSAVAAVLARTEQEQPS